MRKWLIIFLLFVITGCNLNNEGRTNEETLNNGQPMQVKNSTVQNIDRKNGQEIAEHLVNIASRVPKVNDATAVVIGNYAFVGIDVDGNLERSEVGMIKYSVAESLKKDPYGAQAVVVADPDLTARLKEIGEDIKNGKPLQGIFNELADISGRLMPEVPGDMFEPDEDSTNHPQGQLKDGEKGSLKKEQEKQSNYEINKTKNNKQGD